ncbi:MAG TPA: family 1 encapsulin nanocompartment shell protein, partial [Candidatus Sumerlaeota bacterium]|nr:family 1 encapsulin nanocompartment shell protein [Candidatus Sumerlaeota bacterium]
MDLMKKNLAPIADEAWDEIEKQAQITLRGNLSARGLVDFDGPHGWKKASVNLGRAKLAESGVIEG